MADYERAYPVDTGAGSTETNSSAWIKNEQEHARIYRLLNSLAAKLEKALAAYESRLSDLESEMVDLRGDMQQEIVALKQSIQNAIDTTIAQLEGELATLRSDMESEISTLRDEVNALKNQNTSTISSMQDDIERLKKQAWINANFRASYLQVDHKDQEYETWLHQSFYPETYTQWLLEQYTN